MKFREQREYKEILKQYFSTPYVSQSLTPLSELFHSIKTSDWKEFISFLKEQDVLLENFRAYIHHIFESKKFNLSLTEANILTENAFIPEFKKRVLNKFLPPLEDEDTIWYMVDYIAVKGRKDLELLRKIPDETLDELFTLLDADRYIIHPEVQKELIFSMDILAWRAIGNALDVDILKMVPEYKNFDNPFMALQNEMDTWVRKINAQETYIINTKEDIYKQLRIYLRQCLDFVQLAFKNSKKYGISGKINQKLLKIKQQILRMQDILEIAAVDGERDILPKSRLLFKKILEYKSHRNNIRSLFDDSTRLLSHLITTHTAETGTHYITSRFGDYMKMFWKASGGGVIVGFLCLLKMFYGYSAGSEFHHAFLYSFNYSMGFIMIYLLHFTLATKQPAMTAATIAQTLTDGKNKTKNYVEFAHLISRQFRSQFIAFVGNVVWAFPVALVLIYAADVLFLENLAAQKSAKLLKDLNPFESKALLHACIAGVFLFLSGLIAGNVGNNSVFFKIPERIAKNPILNYTLGPTSAKKISVFYAKNWGGIMSNFWLGIFLGSISSVGAFLGLDLDIRHITFSAGNFALGLYGQNFEVSSYTFWVSVLTIGLIGFCNFIVSFGLSLVLAFRSRQLDQGELKRVWSALGKYFLKHPLRFFLPIQGKSTTQNKLNEK